MSVTFIFKCLAIMVICMEINVASEELSSSSAIPPELVTQCTNASDIDSVCTTASDFSSSQGDLSSTSTVLYELGSSTKESGTATNNETVDATTSTANEEAKRNPDNSSVPVNDTSATPSNKSDVETSTRPTEFSTTPTPPGKTVGTDQESYGPYGDICSCDVTAGMCDVGCCCDPDCSNGDRLVFSSCHKKPAFAVNPRYCYQTQFVYRNNTEFKTVVAKGGMFCIVEDNVQRTDDYEKLAVSTISDINKLESRKRFYSWRKAAFMIPKFVEVESHKAEEIVWQLRNATVTPFEIPVKVAGGSCQARKAVRYLEDVESECSQLAVDLDSCLSNADFSSESYYKHSFVFGLRKTSNSKLGKFSQQGCFNSSCIPVTPFLCPHAGAGRRDWGKCERLTDIPRPSADVSLGVCMDLVASVRYLVRHNGTQGITAVSAYLTLRNVSVLAAPLAHFTQKFAVEFVWASAKTSLPRRSGRPGYVVGKPLISGVRVVHTSKEENATGREAILLSSDSDHWLAVPLAAPDGLCSDITRLAVAFGENTRASCVLRLGVGEFSSTSKCGDVQKKILKLLVGEAIENVTEAKQFNLYVATFGDSLVENPGDWVKVMLETVPGFTSIVSLKPDKKQLVCKNMITSMHLDVIFAKIGPEGNPQAKVLGVALRFGLPQDLLFDCNPVQCASLSNDSRKSYRITSSVTFVDLTKPAVPHFLEPPVYEVKLPQDFFYPFFSGTSVPKANILLGVTLAVLYVWIS